MHVLDESGHCLPVFKMILVTQQVWVLLIYFLTISWWGNHIWRHNLCLCGHHHSLLQLCILQPERLTNYTTLLHSFIYMCVCVCVCSNFAKKNSHGLFIHELLPEKKTRTRKDQQWTERWDGNQITSICSAILFVSSSTSSTAAAISSGSPAATVSWTVAVEAAEESLEDAASAFAAKTA